MASPAAAQAAEDIYNNNQVIYGAATGNNLTSLTTGGLTDTGWLNSAIAGASRLPGLTGALVSGADDLITGGRYTDPVFGNATQAQVDAHEAALAAEAGSVRRDDGSYDISSWSTPSSNDRDPGPSGADVARAAANQAANDSFTSSRVSDFTSSGDFSRGFATGGSVGQQPSARWAKIKAATGSR